MHRGPILVVDDEAQNLAFMKQVLSDEYKLVFAKNGHEALGAVKKHTPSLILLDVEMPDMDGYEVCSRLKGDDTTKDIPVIFVTSHSEINNEINGFKVGASDFLSKPVDPQLARLRVKNHLSLVKLKILEDSYREAIVMLAKAGDYNDTDTGVHIWRMAAYARLLASFIDWPAEDCDNLELATCLHDTGKIGIPDAILRKPGKLDAQEWEIMKTHTTIGYNILKTSHSRIFQLAAEIALQHHERWDGTGYPQGLKGDAISISARIAAVADVFDALTMRRPYKEPWPVKNALDYIKQDSGKHFDPHLVEIFLAITKDLNETREKYNSIRLSETDPFFSQEAIS